MTMLRQPKFRTIWAVVLALGLPVAVASGTPKPPRPPRPAPPAKKSAAHLLSQRAAAAARQHALQQQKKAAAHQAVHRHATSAAALNLLHHHASTAAHQQLQQLHKARALELGRRQARARQTTAQVAKPARVPEGDNEAPQPVTAVMPVAVETD